MPYDLFYRRQVPRTSVLATGAGVLVILGAALLVPRALRAREVTRYRREYAGDLRRTAEVPAISDADLVRIPRERWT